MASFQDIRNLKTQLLELWASHFTLYPSADSKELERFIEDLKRAHPDESGGELLARIKKKSGPLFHAAAERSTAHLYEVFEEIDRKAGGGRARLFRVVHKPRIVLRAQPSTTAPMICSKRHGDVLNALEVKDGWIRCQDGRRDCWALIDGASLGLGVLLAEEGAAPAPAAAPAGRGGDNGGFPRTFKVSGKKGALLRAKADLDSKRVKPSLDFGQICTVLEETVLPCGTRRLHVVDPVDGYSKKRLLQ